MALNPFGWRERGRFYLHPVPPARRNANGAALRARGAMDPRYPLV